MQFNSDTPRNEITIQSVQFLVPAPFVEGHTVTAGEASALNQLLAENVRNNFAGKMKAAQSKAEETGTPAEEFTQEHLDAYVAEYEFGVRRSGGSRESSFPPDVREARRIATDMIKTALKAKNLTIKSVEPEKMEEMVVQLSGREDVVKEAQRRLKQVEKISIEDLDLAS